MAALAAGLIATSVVMNPLVPVHDQPTDVAAAGLTGPNVAPPSTSPVPKLNRSVPWDAASPAVAPTSIPWNIQALSVAVVMEVEALVEEPGAPVLASTGVVVLTPVNDAQPTAEEVVAPEMVIETVFAPDEGALMRQISELRNPVTSRRTWVSVELL